MKILAFRHFPYEHLGRIADSLGSGYEYVDMYRGQPAPEIRDADGLIFLGGQMSANDDLPYIRAELDLIGQAVSLGKPSSASASARSSSPAWWRGLEKYSRSL